MLCNSFVASAVWFLIFVSICITSFDLRGRVLKILWVFVLRTGGSSQNLVSTQCDISHEKRRFGLFPVFVLQVLEQLAAYCFHQFSIVLFAGVCNVILMLDAGALLLLCRVQRSQHIVLRSDPLQWQPFSHGAFFFAVRVFSPILSTGMTRPSLGSTRGARLHHC